jgi:hypothetical protein
MEPFAKNPIAHRELECDVERRKRAPARPHRAQGALLQIALVRHDGRRPGR